MTYGINIFSAMGKLVYDSNSIAWNQVDTFIVSANTAVSKSYPKLTNRTLMTTQMFINPPPGDGKAIAHTITISGANITVSGGNAATNSGLTGVWAGGGNSSSGGSWPYSNESLNVTPSTILVSRKSFYD